MKIFVTGAKGMLGADLVCILEEKKHKVFATDIEELDITQLDSLNKMIRNISPDVLVNCAAYTDVDKAEEEPEKALLINGIGVQNLAQVCKDLDIDMCHISTDYVFDGMKRGPYMPLDPPNPINAYGYSKLEGEKHIRRLLDKYYIIRTSWLYGRYGRNFVLSILNQAKKHKELRVVSDQLGSPTWSVTLAEVISRMIGTQRYGIYHVTDRTVNGITWYEFACEIIRLAELKVKIIPTKTGEIHRPAKRPKNSLLDLTHTRLILDEDLPTWKKSLKRFLVSMKLE